jgi:hypothetical protein
MSTARDEHGHEAFWDSRLPTASPAFGRGVCHYGFGHWRRIR